jgi:hypothetical protein
MAGDRLEGKGDEGLGVAMLYSTRPGRYRLLKVLRREQTAEPAALAGNSCSGLVRWLAALPSRERGRFDFVVPPEYGDPLDQVTVRSEIV